MNTKFLWCTGISCISILDYFLFSTGNPSLSYSIFAGWFEIDLVAVIAATVLYGYGALKTNKRKSFVLYLLGIVSFSIILLIISPQAKEFAAASVEAHVVSFMDDPVRSKVGASDQTRKLMLDISRRKYTAERESFIPTFRRMDYLLKVETGEIYNLILTVNWKGTSEIWLLPYSNEMGTK